MILVTGATGHLGGKTIDFLLNKVPASNIAALARNEEKAVHLKNKGIDVRIGDYSNVESMVNAFKGIDKLFLISSNDLDDRTTKHKNAIDAAKQAGVKHVVYTSFQRKLEADSPIAWLAQSHTNTEKYLKSSGLNYTIVKNSLYAEYIPLFIGKQVIESGIYFPAGNGKGAYASRNDMAEASANLLLSDDYINKEVTFNSNTLYNFEDIANILSDLSGKEVKYIDVPAEDFKQQLAKYGVSQMMIDLTAGFAEAIKLGEYDELDGTMEKLLGHKATSMRDVLKTEYKL